MSSVTEQEEKVAREEVQEKLKAVVPRDLLPNGAYAPIPGIYDVGWDGWRDLPYADFAKEMRTLDDDFIKENEWLLEGSRMVSEGQLTLEQLKCWQTQQFMNVDLFAVDIAKHIFNNLYNREVRDIIIRHCSEENGHAELKADFLVGAFGLDRVRDVWGAEPVLKHKRVSNVREETAQLSVLKKESPILAYATIPFLERFLPRMNRMLATGLRKHYGFPAHLLSFFDLHTYVDIYHERLGLYLLSKYAFTKRMQELFREAIESNRATQGNFLREMFEALGVKR